MNGCLMKPKVLTTAILVAAAALCIATLPGAEPEKSHLATTVSLRKLADSLHKVIAADRESYARRVVQRLALEQEKLEVAEDWLEREIGRAHV